MDITALIAQGGTGTVTLFAMVLLVGALHGLEPGHSKTMMAAYIIAVRGSAFQAVLLGISAAISHSVIVWVLAILYLLYGNALIAEEMEPVFMMVSGMMVSGGIFILIALWFYVRVRRERQRAAARKTVTTTTTVGTTTITTMTIIMVTARKTPMPVRSAPRSNGAWRRVAPERCRPSASV